MISTIVLVFAICNSFEAIVYILSVQERVDLGIVQDYLRPTADLLMVLNSSVNVFIYVAFRKDFKEKCYELYVQCRSCCRKSRKQNALPAPANISMIPMMRAQLPKTSVEMTSAAASKELGVRESIHASALVSTVSISIPHIKYFL